MTVKQLADKFHLWQQIETVVQGMLPEKSAVAFLELISQIPIRASRATRSLGAYVSRAGIPVCIRLQFAQEPDSLKQTFLHEVAHACDHLSRKSSSQAYRRAHGATWQSWARALGISTACCGESEAVRVLHQKRLKLVAVCQRCGTEFHRVRRFNRNRAYIHNHCGGKIQTL